MIKSEIEKMVEKSILLIKAGFPVCRLARNNVYYFELFILQCFQCRLETLDGAKPQRKSITRAA